MTPLVLIFSAFLCVGQGYAHPETAECTSVTLNPLNFAAFEGEEYYPSLFGMSIAPSSKLGWASVALSLYPSETGVEIMFSIPSENLSDCNVAKIRTACNGDWLSQRTEATGTISECSMTITCPADGIGRALEKISVLSSKPIIGGFWMTANAALYDENGLPRGDTCIRSFKVGMQSVPTTPGRQRSANLTE